jgi:hypothetical protein
MTSAPETVTRSTSTVDTSLDSLDLRLGTGEMKLPTERFAFERPSADTCRHAAPHARGNHRAYVRCGGIAPSRSSLHTAGVGREN